MRDLRAVLPDRRHLSLWVVALASVAVLVVIRQTVSDAHKSLSQAQGVRP